LPVGGKEVGKDQLAKKEDPAGKKEEESGVGVFWSKERCLCVYQMAKFLTNLLTARNVTTVPLGSTSRLRSSFFNTSAGKEGDKRGGGGNVIDVSQAKDVVMALYESLPVPSVAKVPSQAPDGRSTGGEDTAETHSSQPPAAAGSAQEGDASALVWHELEALLNCLIPVSQEAEITEASVAAAKEAGKRVTSTTGARAPEEKVKVGEGEGEKEIKKVGREVKDNRAGGKKGDAKKGDGSKTSTPTAGNVAKKSAKSRNATPVAAPTSTDPNQFLCGTIKCTCDHGLGAACIRSQGERKVPVHPLHDKEKPVKQLHQFPPNELEMIGVGRAAYDSEGDGREGR